MKYMLNNKPMYCISKMDKEEYKLLLPKEFCADPRFRNYCDNYGSDLLKYGFILYKVSDNPTGISEEVKQTIISQFKVEYDELQRKFNEFTILSNHQQEIAVMKSISEYKLQLEQAKRENEQLHKNQEQEAEKIRKQSEVELLRSTEKYNTQLNELMTEINKIKAEKDILTVKMESTYKTQIDKLISENEQLKKDSEHELSSKTIELKRENDKLKHDLELAKLTAESELKETTTKKDAELSIVKAEYEKNIQKYSAEMTSYCANLAAENKQLKESRPLYETLVTLHTTEGANSSLKGAAAQNLVEAMLGDPYYSKAIMVPCNNTDNSCDINFTWHMLRAKIEVKNYGRPINKWETEKFRNDMSKHKINGFNCGIFVSISQTVIGEYNSLGYQWLEGMLLLYFNLNSDARNMRYIINMAMMVLENRIVASDNDEEILIQNFKENYISNELSLLNNEKMIKHQTTTLKMLSDERKRLETIKEEMLKLNRQKEWITLAADGMTPVEVKTVELKIGDLPMIDSSTLSFSQLCDIAYSQILNFNKPKNPPNSIIRNVFGARLTEFNEKYIIDVLIDRAVSEALGSGTFEYFWTQNLLLEHKVLEKLELTPGVKALNKIKYKLLNLFGSSQLTCVLESYDRFKKSKTTSDPKVC